jgi:hypothetical protein
LHTCRSAIRRTAGLSLQTSSLSPCASSRGICAAQSVALARHVQALDDSHVSAQVPHEVVLVLTVMRGTTSVVVLPLRALVCR